MLLSNLSIRGEEIRIRNERRRERVPAVDGARPVTCAFVPVEHRRGAQLTGLCAAIPRATFSG
jgi:hypothetical protein